MIRTHVPFIIWFGIANKTLKVIDFRIAFRGGARGIIAFIVKGHTEVSDGHGAVEVIGADRHVHEPLALDAFVD